MQGAQPINPSIIFKHFSMIEKGSKTSIQNEDTLIMTTMANPTPPRGAEVITRTPQLYSGFHGALGSGDGPPAVPTVATSGHPVVGNVGASIGLILMKK